MKSPGENGAEAESQDPKFETAIFGAEVRHFVDEDRIGQYLIARAKEDLAEAHQALVEVNPSDYAKITALQLDARVANRVRSWLGEAIESGRAAEVQIQQERDEHG